MKVYARILGCKVWLWVWGEKPFFGERVNMGGIDD